MKNVINFFLVLVVMFATMVSFANELAGFTNDKTKSVTNVTFKNVKQGSYLTIKDSNQLILYKELIEKEGHYSRGFDLTSLPDGDYYFELNKEVQIKIIPFKVSLKEVTFDKDSETTIFKPIVYVKNNKVYVSKLSFENEVLDVKITTENNELVLSEKIDKVNDCLGKIYDFSKTKKGTYFIITKSAGRRFVKKIKIQ